MQPRKIDDIIISAFSNVRGTAVSVPLGRFVSAVCGTAANRHSETIAKLRRLDKGKDKDQYNALKKTLPAVTISCKCEQGKTHAHHDNTPNGAFGVDIDGDDNPQFSDWRRVRDILGRLDWCYLSSLSAGGKGVFLVIAVDPSRPHNETFSAVKDYFAKVLGIRIDEACKNINRLRYLSYDTEAVVKVPTSVFDWRPAPQSSKARKNGNADRRPATEDDTKVQAAVRCWVRKGVVLADYRDWYTIASALREVPNGYQYFDQLSRTAPSKYDQRATERQWNASAKLERIHLGSFFQLCHDQGITPREIEREYDLLTSFSTRKTT